jgi:two-component system nitrogen regulation response regulator NtrX
MDERHIIVVSDEDADVRTLLTEVLDDEGYRVRSIHPATHEVIRRAQAGLVILELLSATADETMLLIEQLRHDEATRRLPILVSSTSNMLFGELAETLQRLHCEILVKPFAIEHLLILVARAVGQPLPQTGGGEQTTGRTYSPLKG